MAWDSANRDARPARLAYPREHHQPPLTQDQLSRRTGADPMRIALAEIFPWSLINFSEGEAEALAQGLDVPKETLTLPSDIDAGVRLARRPVARAISCCSKSSSDTS